MGMSKHLKKSLLEFTFSGQPFGSPSASLFMALHTGDPTESGGLGEVFPANDDTAYARQSVVFATTQVGEENRVKNSSSVVFPPVVYGSNGSEYTVTHLSIWDAATGGNMLEYGALANSIIREATIGLTFDPNTLVISLDI